MEIKDRVLHQAARLFLRNGVKSVSMDDIAAELGMSKKTLYKTFANKDEIVLAVITQHLNQAQCECVSVARPAADAVEQMLCISRWAEQQFSDIHPSIFHDLKKYHPAAWRLIEAHKSSFVLEQLTQNLRRGVAEGLFRADLDVAVLARLNLAQIDLTFNPELYPPGEFAPVRVNRVLDDHFLRGVVTRAGFELIERYHQAGLPS